MARTTLTSHPIRCRLAGGVDCHVQGVRISEALFAVVIVGVADPLGGVLVVGFPVDFYDRSVSFAGGSVSSPRSAWQAGDGTVT